MKKNRKLFAIPLALVLSLTLLAACGNNESAVENATVNQPDASAPTVNSEELSSITPDKAIDIALGHAGVDRENAALLGTPSLDNDDAVPHYEVEFVYDNVKYDYEIAVSDGKVLKAEKERPDSAPTEKAEADTNKNTQPATTKPANKGYISVEDAKAKAIADAKVDPKDVVFTKAYYDADDFVPHFDIKFEANGKEYEYEIKAADGTVLEKDVDRADRPAQTSQADSSYITADEAKSIALKHAAVTAADAKRLEAELDLDDITAHYDVEFSAGRYEYEYEINAVTGKIITSEKDLND